MSNNPELNSRISKIINKICHSFYDDRIDWDESLSECFKELKTLLKESPDKKEWCSLLFENVKGAENWINLHYEKNDFKNFKKFLKTYGIK